jgi:sugar transferase (PEP-CTERM/EpsH1 system associated)
VSASAVRTTSDRTPARAPVSRSLRILFLTGRFPAPPHKGDQLRAFQQIRRLGPRHRITLVYLTRGAPADDTPLQAYCERIVPVPFSRAAMGGGLLRGIVAGLPLQAALYQTEAMRAALRTLSRDGFDLVHVQLARMVPYLEDGVLPRPWVVDLVDALSLGMERRTAAEWGLRRLLARIEAERLRRYERRVAAAVDRMAVVSPRDREALGGGPGLFLVPNAVDLDSFPYSRGARDRATVALTGNMGYYPNVDAALFFAKEVLPLLRRRVKDARFLIAGARPARAVRTLAVDPAVTVTGPVDDMGVFLRRATVAVCPMRTGSGQQIKILEAMASGAPVVASAAEAEQVGARDDREILIASSAAEFAESVAALIEDPERADRIARHARRLVEERFTWERSVAALEEVYASALQGRAGLAGAAEAAGARPA